MRPILYRRLLALTSLAGLASGVLTVAAATPAVPAAAGATAVLAAARSSDTPSPGTESRPVLLINGMRLLLGQGPGGAGVAMLPPSRPASPRSFAALISMKIAGQAVEIPADALPFVGHGLDMGLFSVGALARTEHAGRLPVRVTYHGQRTPAPPGVIITHAAGGVADGYLTAGSAPKFGAALRRQFLADHGRSSYGTDGLFAHGLSITLAGAPAVPHPTRSRFVMHTLSVQGTNLAGRPDNGDNAIVINADDPARFYNAGAFFHGVTKFSVPAGRYWAIGEFTDLTGGLPTGLRLAVVPQFTVPASRGAAAHLHLDERSATSRVTVTTPRPAVRKQTSISLVRSGPGGPPGVFGLGLILGARGFKFWISPTSKKPTVGSLRSFTSGQLTSPPGAAVPYVYNLDFRGPAGRIPTQHFVVHQASLATVDERYYQDLPSTGAWATFGGSAAELRAGLGEITEADRLALPGRQTQYFTADPGILWLDAYWEFASARLLAGQHNGSFGALRGGRHLTVNWGRYPLHPAPTIGLSRANPFPLTPSAARAGDLLTLGTTPFSDNTLGHVGSGFHAAGPGSTVRGRFEIDQDGARLAAGDAVKGIPSVRLSQRPSVIRFTLTASRTGKSYLLSPASSTTWTWRSARDTAASVPPPWVCRASTGVTRRCAVQPMMTLNYQVARLALNGSAPPGRQVIGLSAGHIQLASAPAITGATARVSFDGGKTWRPATVTAAGPGRFRAVFRAKPGAFVTLRVTATDAAGGSITETIQRAYKITS